MVTDIELASVKLVEKFCRRIEGQYVELAMQPYAPRAFRFIELLRIRHNPKKLSPAKPADSSVCVWDLICNPSSERLGLSMCCASRTLLTLMVILRNVCTKMHNF